MRQHLRFILGFLTAAVLLAQVQQPPVAIYSICTVRLTLTAGTPVTTSDVTAATSVFVTPMRGGQCGIYDGTASWNMVTVAEQTVSVPATTSTMYDVFCYNNNGTLGCDAATAWTNDSTRATGITLQNGIYVKSGTTTRRYIGSFRTTTASGQTEDSVTKRYVWNYYNRVPRALSRAESTASWPYSTATIRQANGSTANQVDVVVGVAEVKIDLFLFSMPAVNNSGGATIVNTGIGEDSTTTFTVVDFLTLSGSAATVQTLPSVRLVKVPAVGRHFYSWNEYSAATPTTTWYGATSFGGAVITTGLQGWIEG